MEREAGSGKRGGADALPASRFPLPDRLRGVAESLLASAKHGPPTRSTALTLLAADALITLAVEARAQDDPTSLSEMV